MDHRLYLNCAGKTPPIENQRPPIEIQRPPQKVCVLADLDAIFFSGLHQVFGQKIGNSEVETYFTLLCA